MQTITFNITNPAAYDILLQLSTQLAGVEVATTAAIAEDDATPYWGTPKKARDLTKFIGCLTYPKSDGEAIEKLNTIRAEWDRDF